MKTHLKTLMLLGLLILGAVELQAQTGPKLITGEQAPSLTLNVYERHSGKARPRSLESYRGKWLIIDFWAKYCSVCISSMPKLAQLQRQFQQQANFLLVGNNDKHNRGIQALYERIRKSEKLELDYSFDSVAFARFKVSATPFVFIIDPQGVIRSISIGQELSEQTLSQLLGGTNGLTQIGSHGGRQRERRSRQDSLGTHPHQSKLETWLKTDPLGFKTSLKASPSSGIFSSTGSSLARLYQLASFGQSDWQLDDSLRITRWPKPLLQTRDSALFRSNSNRELGLYNYSVEFASGHYTASTLQQALSKDLWAWFGHKVTIRREPMPVWKLVVTDQQLLAKWQSKQIAASKSGDYSGADLKGYSTAKLARMINLYTLPEVVIDATGITYSIDLEFKALMTSPASVAEALKPFGLTLIRGHHPMEVLVISDP